MKWTAPLESGGLPLEYVVEMNPPPGKGDANIAPPTTSDVSFCCSKIVVCDEQNQHVVAFTNLSICNRFLYKPFAFMIR